MDLIIAILLFVATQSIQLPSQEPCIMVFTLEKETIRYEDGGSEIIRNQYSTMSPGCKDIDRPDMELSGS